MLKYRSAAIHSPWGYIETQKISMAQKLLDKKIMILSHTFLLSFDIIPWATNRGTTVILNSYHVYSILSNEVID